jgi:hypothetical protein
MGISPNAQPARNKFHRYMSQRRNGFFYRCLSQQRNFPETNLARQAQSSDCIQPASLSSKLCIYALLIESIQPFLARSYYILASTPYMQKAILSW